MTGDPQAPPEPFQIDIEYQVQVEFQVAGMGDDQRWMTDRTSKKLSDARQYKTEAEANVVHAVRIVEVKTVRTVVG